MKSTLIICLPNRKQSHDNLEKGKALQIKNYKFWL